MQQHGSMVANILPKDQSIKIQLFQNTVVMHIKLK